MALGLCIIWALVVTMLTNGRQPDGLLYTLVGSVIITILSSQGV